MLKSRLFLDQHVKITKEEIEAARKKFLENGGKIKKLDDQPDYIDTMVRMGKYRPASHLIE